MLPTTLTVTSGCALSYSAASALKLVNSLPALQPTQIVSLTGDELWAVPARAAASARAPTSTIAAAMRLIAASRRVETWLTFRTRCGDSKPDPPRKSSTVDHES